ncbi:MAG: tRNA pseudouridine(55) synthase TruB [Balneolaceae bacterium]
MAKKAIPISELPVFDSFVDSTFPLQQFHTGSIILMDKPLEWTSFDVVRYVRNRIPPKKVGHAGTLDPLATGLLILCSGKATKSISMIQDQSKEYVATIKFGESTPSYDAALPADKTMDWEHITQEMIEQTIQESFTGLISQVPPIYSAIKVNGERLYKKARRGEKVEIKSREIEIYSTEILDVELPYIKVKIHCGKGTYIRSFAHDLGIALNSRAHLTGLRRTRIGNYTADNSVLPVEFNKIMEAINHG